MKGIVRYQSHVVRHNLELVCTWRENRMIGKGCHMILLVACILTGCEQVMVFIASHWKILAAVIFFCGVPHESLSYYQPDPTCPENSLCDLVRVFSMAHTLSPAEESLVGSVFVLR